MNKKTEFSFNKERRVTPEENQKFRQAISEQFGIKFRRQKTIKQHEDDQKL
ncbi:hypothetical protein [Cyanothece sp. BG0011]|uniref:hypothetical protein n=1 Tax=Cyanothece sp. BG0011 TaxID=2082950 RepID=UPI0018E4FCE1|nr:hypothetical protein [Cyanothece sp. BG0011]